MHKHFAEDKHCREIPSNDRVWMFLSRLTLTFAFLDLQNISLFPLSVVSPGRIISSLIPQESHMINFLSKGYNDPLYGRGSFYIRIVSLSLFASCINQLFIRSWIFSHLFSLTQTLGPAICSLVCHITQSQQKKESFL